MREQVPNPVPEHGGRDVGIMDLSALRARLVHKLQEQRRHVVVVFGDLKAALEVDQSGGQERHGRQRS